jgi:ribonuclease D
MPTPRWARRPDELARAVTELAAAPEIALDTEGDSLHHYPERLALIQLGLPGGDVWLVDPLALEDLSPLEPVFAGERPCLVVHAGDNDLVQLKRRFGFGFASVFDTSIAARFLGATSLGLDTLLERYLGVILPPSRQKDDWSARPLNEAQVDYAAADVRHLFALKTHLADELDRVGRLAWVAEECAALAAQPAPEPVDGTFAYLGARGARELVPREQAVLRELWNTRDELARAADRPPFKVLSAEMLVAVARAAPRDAEALAAVPAMTPRARARWGAAILAAVERGLALDEAEIPVPVSRPRPRVPGAIGRRVERLRTWRAAAAPRVGLEPGVFLPNRLITAIALAGPRTLDELAAVEGVRRWRVDAFGPEILAALARP